MGKNIYNFNMNNILYLLQELKFTIRDFEYFDRFSITNKQQLSAQPSKDL
jgi:hypothetical protein